MGHLNFKSQVQLFDIPLVRHPSCPKFVGEVGYMVCRHMKPFDRHPNCPKFVGQVGSRESGPAYSPICPETQSGV